MISDRETLRRHLGGLPFISDTFRAKIVSSLVAAKRQSALGHAQHTEGSGYLTPDAGVRYLTEPHYRSLYERWRKCPGLMPAQIARSDRTRRAIIAREPTWESLLHIPVRFVVPDDPAVVNASNPLVPQTIALGHRAFESQDLLTTALIHEYAHVWMGLICEIADIDNGRDRRRFILPSGTGDKTLRTVVFAAHFAVACGRYFGFDTPYRLGSALTYGSYARESLDLCAGSVGLSVMGEVVWHELSENVMPIG